jgi:hypothetical protein
MEFMRRKRTRPDCVVYRPKWECGPERGKPADHRAGHGGGPLAAHLDAGDAREQSGPACGREPQRGSRRDVARAAVDRRGDPGAAGGAGKRGKYQASWAFFIEAPALGRIYLFYNKNIGVKDARDDTTGVLRCRYSEDEGRSWSEPHDYLRIRRGAIDHPNPGDAREFRHVLPELCWRPTACRWRASRGGARGVRTCST